MSISLILFVACKPGVPNRYIQPSELGDILYEYHLAEGITSLKNDTTALYYYKNNILKKHNVTSAECDSSMVYYLRHADELKKVSQDKKIIVCLCLDNDEAGEIGTREFKEKLKSKNIYTLDIRKNLLNFNIFTEDFEEKKAKLERRFTDYRTYFVKNIDNTLQNRDRYCYKDLNERLQKDRQGLLKDIEAVNKLAEVYCIKKF